MQNNYKLIKLLFNRFNSAEGQNITKANAEIDKQFMILMIILNKKIRESKNPDSIFGILS